MNGQRVTAFSKYVVVRDIAQWYEILLAKKVTTMGKTSVGVIFTGEEITRIGPDAGCFRWASISTLSVDTDVSGAMFDSVSIQTQKLLFFEGTRKTNVFHCIVPRHIFAT